MKSISSFLFLVVCISLALTLDTIPGAETLLGGYDAVTGQGGLNPVFKFHNTAGKTYYNPFTQSTYSVPDEIDVATINQVHISAVETVSEHFTQYLKTVYEASWFGINIGIPGYFALAFHYGKEMGETHFKLSDMIHAVAHGFYRYELYNLVGTIPEFMELDDTFSSFLDMLPETISNADDQQLYNQLITAYGTHVSYKNTVGGNARVNTFMKQDYVESKDSKWVAEQISLSFQYSIYQIGGGYFHNTSEIKIDKDFKENSETHLYFYGGNPSLQEQGSEKEWLRSVPTMPYACNVTLQAIDTIIPNAKVAANVKDTIDYYVKNQAFPTDPVHHAFHSIGIVMDSDLEAIPGADFIGHGVDEANLGVPLKPVIDFTYNRGTVYQNPIYPDLKWKVPDQIPAVIDQPESLDMNGTFIFEEVQDYVQWTYHSSSSHGLFSSHSKSTTTFYERYYENDEAMSLALKEYSWYKLTLAPFPPPQPSAGLKSVLSRMPTTYASDYDKRMWRTFITTYGTAYYGVAVLGGSMKCTTWFHKCFLTEDSATWVSEQSGWSIFGIIGSGHVKKEAESKIDKNFNSYHETEVVFIGGDDTIPPDQWEDWVKSIKKNPAPVESTIMPIENLMTGPYAGLVNAFKAAKADYQAEIDAANSAAAAQYQAEGQHKTPDWCHPK